MGIPLAIPSFSSGPRNDLAVQDVYKVVGEKPINSIKDISQAPDPVNVNQMDASTARKALDATFSVLKTGVGFLNSKGTTVDKLIAGSGIAGAAMKAAGMPQSMLQSIAATVKDGGALYAMGVGTVQRLKSGNLTDVAAISNAIGKMTDQTGMLQIVNRDLTTGAIGGILKQATANGVPTSFAALQKTITDQKVINGVIRQIVPSVIKNSDKNTLKEMAVAAPGQVQLAMPAAISDFSFGYKSGPETTSAVRKEDFADITATYEKVDPNWKTSTRDTPTGPEKIVDISKLSTASDDLKRTIEVGIKTSDKIEDKVLILATKKAAKPPFDLFDSMVQANEDKLKAEAAEDAAADRSNQLSQAQMADMFKRAGG